MYIYTYIYTYVIYIYIYIYVYTYIYIYVYIIYECIYSYWSASGGRCSRAAPGAAHQLQPLHQRQALRTCFNIYIYIYIYI